MDKKGARISNSYSTRASALVDPHARVREAESRSGYKHGYYRHIRNWKLVISYGQSM